MTHQLPAPPRHHTYIPSRACIPRSITVPPFVTAVAVRLSLRSSRVAVLAGSLHHPADVRAHCSSLLVVLLCPGWLPKCWIRMPTGCGKTLSETSTPKEWFADGSHSCSAARLAVFNKQCSRFDAKNFWAVSPPGGSSSLAVVSVGQIACMGSQDRRVRHRRRVCRCGRRQHLSLRPSFSACCCTCLSASCVGSSAPRAQQLSLPPLSAALLFRHRCRHATHPWHY